MCDESGGFFGGGCQLVVGQAGSGGWFRPIPRGTHQSKGGGGGLFENVEVERGGGRGDQN